MIALLIALGMAPEENSVAADAEAMSPRVRYWQRIFAINCLATLLVAAANGAFTGRMPLRTFAGTLVAAFVYCNCVGGFCGLLLPRVTTRSCTFRFPLNWMTIIGVLLAINAAGCLLAMLVLMAIGLSSASGVQPFVWAYWENFKAGAFFTLVFGIGGTLYFTAQSELERTSRELETKRQDEERARQAATEAKLSSLESRVRPHFLFNTLNAISALVHEDPEQAERLIDHLSSLLRSSLDASDQPTIPLGEELQLVRNYLDIERTRFDHRVRFTIDLPESLADAAVPPFSIQPLVENAVKYAVAPQRAGATVWVRARREAGKLVVMVIDDGPGFREVKLLPGHGLHTLKARLDVLFGSEARLDISRENHQTIIAITMPLLAPVSPTS